MRLAERILHGRYEAGRSIRLQRREASLALGYWLLAVGCFVPYCDWRLAVGYWPLAVGYWLLAIGGWLWGVILR